MKAMDVGQRPESEIQQKNHVERAIIVSAKYCYVTHELRLHQNDRCKRFTLF